MKQSNLTKIFKALSNEHRLQLFKLLYTGFKKGKRPVLKKGDACCDGIEKAFTSACDCLNLSRSTISHHFKELQNAGLITCTRKGQSYVCQVNQEAVTAIRQFLN